MGKSNLSSKGAKARAASARAGMAIMTLLALFVAFYVNNLMHNTNMMWKMTSDIVGYNDEMKISAIKPALKGSDVAPKTKPVEMETKNDDNLVGGGFERFVLFVCVSI